jgi:drug/metabolite transporter (DMT)-like permease
MATRQFVPLRILLSINLIFSTAVVLLSGAAALRIPVRNASIIVTTIPLASAAWLTFHLQRRKPGKSCLLFFVIAVITVSSAIWPAIQKKVFIIVSNDTWAYVAFGQYLNDYFRGTEGGLSAVDQFGASLSNTRFGTPTLLAFLSDLTDRTTAEVLTPWAWLVLLNVFAGAGFRLARMGECAGKSGSGIDLQQQFRQIDLRQAV